MKNILFLILILTNITVQSQNIYEKKTIELFDKIILNIGNMSKKSPEIKLVETEFNPASFNPRNKTIFIEKKLIKLFQNNPNFEDIMSYIISHELAHHYLSHGWMKNVSFAYTSFEEEILEKKEREEKDEFKILQRKQDESQADMFGGFYAKISGFDALNYAEFCLRTIYSEYGFEDPENYPTLNQRVEMAKFNLDETNELANIFDIGNLALVIGEYELAKDCFNTILNHNFTSREIYNNMGTAFLLKAVSMLDKEKSKYIFPIYIDEQTRADNKVSTRSAGSDDIIEELEQAKEYFNNSILKDNEYLPAIVNKLNVDFIENLVLDKLDKDFYKTLEQKINIDNKRVNDLMVLFKIFSSKKLKNKDVANGSIISNLNFKIYNNDLNNVIDDLPPIIKYADFNTSFSSDFLFENPKRMYYKKPWRMTNLKRSWEYDKYSVIGYRKSGSDNYVFVIIDDEYINEVSEYIESIDIVFNKTLILNSYVYKISDINRVAIKYDTEQNIKAIINY